ncbi:hypothetical protein EOE67_16270 [Rheinheimera riviphila]|uniref:Uncharacterized protein n=1 Tax=Rheinheimera riviphila TaxID=1834037 RepID=A0A437QG99_9GAMM|nr:hypothetical protein [Rheinheimera riviphila]RVU33571.1 hypothetical protein EOE67_16270 [Rheinheimera riviphila]
MPTTPPAAEIFNCLKASFDQTANNAQAQWSLDFSRQQNRLLLSVQIGPTEPLKAGSCLQSSIDADGLNTLSEFLAQVKMQMANPG